MPRRTFQKKLYELVNGNLIERNPPSKNPCPHTGKKVSFKLTLSGQKTVSVNENLTQFETHYQNILERLVEHSLEIGEGKPLTGATLYLISQKLPICTIAHLPSKTQYEKLKIKLDNDTMRLELGKLLNKLIEFYVSGSPEDVTYEFLMNSIFIMSILSKEQSVTMKEAVDKGLFSEYLEIMKILMAVVENTWNRIWNFLQDPKNLDRDEPLIIVNGFQYNRSDKKLTIPPREELLQKLKQKFQFS